MQVVPKSCQGRAQVGQGRARGCKFSTGTGIWNYQQSGDLRDLGDLAFTNKCMGIPRDPPQIPRDLEGIPRDLTRDPPRSIYQQFRGIPRDLSRDPQGFGGIPRDSLIELGIQGFR